MQGEGLNVKQENFRMADVSNLKISERLIVEQPNLRDSRTEEIKIECYVPEVLNVDMNESKKKSFFRRIFFQAVKN